MREGFDYKWLDILIEKLPEIQKDVIRKTVFSNVKLVKIAAQLKVSRQRVHQIRQQAFRSLERMMEKHGR